MEEKEIHLVKKVSKELGVTYKELADEIGYTEASLKKSVYDNKISSQLKKSIELYLRNLKLEKELTEMQEMKNKVGTFIKYFSN